MSPNLGDRLEVLEENGAGEGAKEREVKTSRSSLEEGGSGLGPQMHMAGEEAGEFPVPSPVSSF